MLYLDYRKKGVAVMKLSAEEAYVTECFEKNKHKIAAYAERLRKHGTYKDFSVRLSMDLFRSFVPDTTSTMCQWYEKYNCNDDNIVALAKKVTKKYYMI